MDLIAILKHLTLIIIVAAALHVMERLAPAERNQSYRSVLTNGRATLIYLFLRPLSFTVASYGIGFLSFYILGRPGAIAGLWIFAEGPFRPLIVVVIPLLFVATYDFFYYWFHRLQHSVPWLWEQHKLHHSDQALNVSTSYRINWLEDFFKSIFVSLPIAVSLGATPPQAGALAALAMMFVQVWGQVLHSNIRWSFGVFTPVLAGPQFHRIHHSIEIEHQDKNFSTHLPVWDVLFGTYYHPAAEEYPRTGVVGEPSDPDTWEIIAGPFRSWARVLRRKRKDNRKQTTKSV